MTSLDQLNQMPRAAFVELLGDIFEHSPWVADQTWPLRPFACIADLHLAMCKRVAVATDEAKMALIRAHPELAGKAAVRGELSASSTLEQQSAGLDACSAEEFAQICSLNAAYGSRFGFPFILAVRGHSRSSIIEQLRLRLDHQRDEEIAEALRQIEHIAAFRLRDRLQEEERRLRPL